MDSDIRRDLLILVGIAILMKGIVILLTTMPFHSFIDFWDLSYYFENTVLFANGQIPYLDFPFDYPALAWIPMMVAYFVAPFISGFILTFMFFMQVFDALTIIGIYYIAYAVWNSKSRAFSAALLYVISLPVAYFTLVRFDPLPVCIMVWTVYFTLKGETLKGYIGSAVGFLVKVFPIICMPIFVIWNSKGGNLKTEVKTAALAAALVILPFMALLGSVTGRLGSGGQIYANTPTYLLYLYLNKLLHLPVTAEQVSWLMYILAGIVLVAIGIRFVRAEKKPEILLAVLMLAIFITVFVSRLHSPQYLLWYLPFLCLLVAGDKILSAVLILSQIVIYLEFPILFGRVYTNAEYLVPAYSQVWYLAICFFTFEYLLILGLILIIISNLSVDIKYKPYTIKLYGRNRK